MVRKKQVENTKDGVQLGECNGYTSKRARHNTRL
jgi:hypothetical protein